MSGSNYDGGGDSDPPPVTLGDITFTGFEVPEKIPFGGTQQLTVHKLPGGARVIDAMGGDDKAIEWSGYFRGPDAASRARVLDAMRCSAQQLQLNWADFARAVVIQEFTCDYTNNGALLPYRISLVVVPQAALSPPPPTLSQQLNDDVSSAQDVPLAIPGIGLINDVSDTLGDAASAVSGAINQVTGAIGSVVSSVEGAIGSAVSSVEGAVSDAFTAIGLPSLLTGIGNVANALDDAAALLPTSTVALTLGSSALAGLSDALGTAGDLITSTVATVNASLDTVTNAMEGVGFLPGGPAAQILAATEAASALGWLAATGAYAGRAAANALNAGA